MVDHVMVTGGAGYIGSHVVKLLGESGHPIVTYDNLSTGFKESVLHGEFVEGDLADLIKVEETIKKYSVKSVIHFAGSIIVPESVSDPIKYYMNNTSNSMELIKLCLKHNVENFIFSSTAAVYGMGEGTGVTESSPTNPINPYGRSKLMTEWMLEDAAFANKNFNYIALRYFNVAGADFEGKIGQKAANATHLITVALKAALGKKDKLQLFGTDYDTKDGTCIRDFIHVTDLGQAHLDALGYLKERKKSHILNCGYGHGYSVREILDIVKEVSGVNFPVEEVGRRPGDPGIIVAVSEQVRDILGWTPKYDDVKAIVESAYNWEKSLPK